MAQTRRNGKLLLERIRRVRRRKRSPCITSKFWILGSSSWHLAVICPVSSDGHFHPEPGKRNLPGWLDCSYPIQPSFVFLLSGWPASFRCYSRLPSVG